MKSVEKLAKLMMCRESSNNLYMTTMDTAKTCTVNNLKLTEEDLLISEHLTSKYLLEYADGTCTYSEPIQAGDTVLVVKINDSLFAILERLVSV